MSDFGLFLLDSFTQECIEEKSFFCRVSVGKNRDSDMRYQPFRMTPYLVRVPEPQGAESQLCCVLLAERVHSGYEEKKTCSRLPVACNTMRRNATFSRI
ncbi:period circadian protein homolog 2-like [Pteropus vampyrus]|uniref:Period circadian protein homolog 2-like n=1 Tax=Pteropus vampyrus TaxID=132908 RepID=A0A6P6C5J2_PTEVA|nr:period circadian protein homolog 2-like [Pteropus vampyrus]